MGLLGLLGSLVSCGTPGGPRVTICIVDASLFGYQCTDMEEAENLIPFIEDGTDLFCTSPSEVEAFLKACKQHKILETDLCQYQKKRFACKKPNGQNYHLEIKAADNYVCLSTLHRSRIIERC